MTPIPAVCKAVARLRAVTDPVADEIYKYRVAMRQLYNSQRFEELEKNAVPLRAEKPLFANGNWKIVEFYQAFGCRQDEPEAMWQLHDHIHQN